MWDWLVFCDCGFHSVCPLMEEDKRLMEASWLERLRGKLGLILMGAGGMLSKSLVQLSVLGQGCVLSGPNPAAGHCRPMPLLETPVHSQASLGQSLVGSLLLSPGSWCTQDFVCALLESVSTVLCKFWWFYGGVNGNLLHEGLCHTQVYCTQSPCPCSSPLLICTSAGDIQTQFCLSLCMISGSWCGQVCLSKVL